MASNKAQLIDIVEVLQMFAERWLTKESCTTRAKDLTPKS